LSEGKAADPDAAKIALAKVWARLMSNSVVVKTALVNPPVNKQGSDANAACPLQVKSVP